jgi:IS30 family transposase
MKSYKHFTSDERECLQQLLAKNMSMRKIADILEKSPSSISREIKRNRAKFRPHKKPDNKYWYNSWRAQNLYIQRRRQNQHRALHTDTEEWDFICAGLKQYWSPEAICGRWKLLHPNKKTLCAATIYRYIKRNEFPEITVKKHLRRRGKRFTPRNSNYNTIHPDRIIPDWIDEIKSRSRIGDWEGDTVYGGVGKGLLVTLVDRKSRFLCAGRLNSRNSGETKRVIEALLTGKTVTSISFDNGSEFALFRDIEQSLRAPVYFAEPHKPWQRGTNENTNDILRFFFPKGFDFLSLDDDFLQSVVLSINLRPRKCLNWKSPFEVFFGVALA